MVDNEYSIVKVCNIMGRQRILVTIATDCQRPFNDQQSTNGPPWPRQSVPEQPTSHHRPILANAMDDNDHSYQTLLIRSLQWNGPASATRDSVLLIRGLQWIGPTSTTRDSVFLIRGLQWNGPTSATRDNVLLIRSICKLFLRVRRMTLYNGD